VAYVRFASVYREFKDVNQFLDELKPLLDRAGPGGKEGQAPKGAREPGPPAPSPAPPPASKPNDKPAGSPHGAAQP